MISLLNECRTGHATTDPVLFSVERKRCDTMVTPLELRNWKRSAQRTVRLVFLDVTEALKKWKVAIVSGKLTLTDISNGILESMRIPDLATTGVLKTLPHTRRILEKRIKSRLKWHLLQIDRDLRVLEAAVETLHVAKNTFAELTQYDDDDPRLNAMVFTSMSGRDILQGLSDIEDMHRKELEVKLKSVQDMKACGSSLSTPSLQNDNMEEYLLLHITSWTLGVYTKSEQIELFLQKVAQDAGMPYASS